MPCPQRPAPNTAFRLNLQQYSVPSQHCHHVAAPTMELEGRPSAVADSIALAPAVTGFGTRGHT